MGDLRFHGRCEWGVGDGRLSFSTRGGARFRGEEYVSVFTYRCTFEIYVSVTMFEEIGEG